MSLSSVDVLFRVIHATHVRDWLVQYSYLLLHSIFCREYKKLRTAYNRQRRVWDSKFMSFHEWLSNHVEECLNCDLLLDLDVVMLACTPSARIEEYLVM
jgi:hypothetical protein